MDIRNSKIAAAYIRVSTDDQLDLSPDSQLDEIRKYAKANNYIINEDCIFVEKEGISGRKAAKRPEFQRMIATAKTSEHPFDVIIVWKFSRFARNQDESTYYKSILRKKCNVDIVSVSEPMIDGMYGRLIEMIIEWQDEFYSYNLSTEVKRGMRKNAELGGANSKPPIGYTRENKKTVIVPEEANIVKYIFNEYSSGTELSSLSRALNDKGLRTCRGNMFTTETVRYILTNPYYIGKIRWNMRESSSTSTLKPTSEWIIANGHHEKIISEDLFNSCQKRIESSAAMHRKYQHGIHHGAHYLSGMLRCSVCGSSFSIKRNTKKNRVDFQCIGYKKGIHSGSQQVTAAAVTDALVKSLQEVLCCHTDFTVTHSDVNNNNDLQISLIKDELNSIKKKEERIKQAYINGIDTLDEYKKNKTALQKRRIELESQINKTDPSPEALEEIFTTKIKYAAEVIQDENIDDITKAQAIRSVIDHITYYKDEKRIDVCYRLII